MRRPFARRTVCIDVPLNLVIAGTAGEYLTLVIAAVVVARPTSNYAHALAAVLTGWIAYANASAHPPLI
jgi:hypothetical protein